ncbi:hypothetical protein, partial [Paenibacillus odorifer]|uniref:hypothetical protein n=1 Tax=Paenibacillus odorifer TaxID=189426 RepID=UPI0015C40036
KGDKLVNSIIGVRKPQQEIMVSAAVAVAVAVAIAVDPANDYASAVSDSVDLKCRKIRHLEYYRTA